MKIPHLFQPLTLRGVTLRNRIGVSPMCQYSCRDGFPGEWHLVHLGARAVGGAGLVMVEATAVTPEGRISPEDAGLWKDDHIESWARIARFVADHGAVPGIQLAHAGWKASTAAPWLGGGAVTLEKGGWQPIAVGSTAFAPDYPVPRMATPADLERICAAWLEAVRRALAAGFRLVEIHAAHGYLLHSFLSPLTNHRSDDYGGSFENRSRLLLRISHEVRGILPDDIPLSVRLSCSDWMEGGWTLDDSVKLAALLRDAGVDLIDCSSGGASPSARIPAGPGYQTGFSAAIRREARVPTAAVGMIVDPHQAETILATGQADLVLIARELLRDPYWPRTAARALGHDPESLVPDQYRRAW